MVSADYVSNLSKHIHILLILYIDRALHIRGADGSVYVCGENASDPFHFALKSRDTDSTSRSTLRNSQVHCVSSTLAHPGMGASQTPAQVLIHL